MNEETKDLLAKLEQQKSEAEETLTNEFIEAYQELVKQYGREIVASPVCVQTGGNGFALSVQYTVLKTQEKGE